MARRPRKTAAAEAQEAEIPPETVETDGLTAEQQGAEAAASDTHGGEGDAPPPEAPPPEEAPPDETPPHAPMARSSLNDRRAAIAKKLSQSRPDTDAEPGPTPAADEAAPAEGEQPPEAAAPAAPAEKHRIKVDGREIELSTEQLIQAAQLGYAGEERLRELNDLKSLTKTQQRELETLLAQAKDLVQSRERGTDSPPDHRRETPSAEQDRETPPTKARGLDKDRLRAVFEEGLYGDADKAAEDFAALFEEASATAPQEQLNLEDVAAFMDARNRTLRARDDFVEHHPEIAADPDLQFLAARAMHGRAVAELGDFFRREGIAAEQYQQTLADPATAFEWHNAYRSEGNQGFSTYDQIVDDATAEIGRKVGIQRYVEPPAPSPGQQQPAPSSAAPPRPMAGNGQAALAAREQRKEEMAPQPRRAAVVAPRDDSPAGARPRPSVGSIASQKRQQRGYRVT